jgi:hypothetical protein
MTTPSLINVYEIPTNSGYKSIELHHADLCDFPKQLDCLVFSAFEGSYAPVPKTLIAALQNTLGVNCSSLSTKPAIDLSSEFDVWLSEPLGLNFNRLACVELRKRSKDLIDFSHIVNNLFTLFLIMDQLEIQLKNVALPVIGTGSQAIDSDLIIPAMIQGSINGLEKIEQLKTVYIVEVSKEKIQYFDKLMNDHLKRSQEDINDIYGTKYYRAILEELEDNINTLLNLKKTDSIEELVRKLRAKNLRTFELGILSRRICEEILDDLHKFSKADGRINLSEKITSLYEMGIASWIISYFHTIRIFGNFYAHNKAITSVYPSKHFEQDILVLISSLNRIVIFYKTYICKT